MNLSRPFNKNTLGIIGALLLVISGVLVLSAASTGLLRLGGWAGPPTSSTESVGSTSPSHDGQSPTAAIGEETPVAAPSSVSVTRSNPTRVAGTVQALPSLRHDQVPDSTASPSTPASTPTLTVSSTEWRRVQIEDVSVSFEVPADWQRLGAAWAWSTDGQGSRHVGFQWSDGSSPGQLLPAHSAVTAIRPVSLGWAEGKSYQVEVMAGGSLVAIERHVVVLIDTDLSGDFYITGRSTADLKALEPVLGHLLSTITYQTVADGPVAVSVGFLTALLEDPSGERAVNYLSSRLQDSSPMALLHIDSMFNSFSVAWSGAADGRIQVLATLQYAGDRVEQRVLGLIQQDGAWRIDAIATEV